MYSSQLINRIATYLIIEQIQSISDELPDVPDFNDVDPDFAQMWGQSHSRKITGIQNRRESVEKILNHGVSLVGDISLVKGGYHHYVTSRIHEFAASWLENEEKKNQESKVIAEKRAKNKYNDVGMYGDESFQNDEYEWATNGMEEEQLDELGIDTWDELVEIVKSIKNYSFQSSSQYYSSK